MARRNERNRPVDRAEISLIPAVVISMVTWLAAAILLAGAWLARDRDGWMALVWAIPGAYLLVLPLRGFVRGRAERLTVGFRRYDLAQLTKVAVYDRKQFGLKYSVAVLKFPDRVEEISGMYLTTRSFTDLVEWFKVRIEVLEGNWNPRRLASERPDLAPSRARR